MEQIIKGATLGAYITTGASLGKGQYQDAAGNTVAYKYVRLSVRDQYTPSAQPRAMLLFCSTSPEIQDLYDILKGYIKKDDQGNTEKDRQGNAVVDWRTLKKSGDDWEELKEAGWTIFPGADVVNVPLQKGKCYRNDKNGNRIITMNGQPIITDTLQVLVIVKDIRVSGDSTQTTYVSGWDPISQRNELEQRFYQVPVTAQVDNTLELPLMTPTEATLPPVNTPAEQPKQAARNIDDEF